MLRLKWQVEQITRVKDGTAQVVMTLVKSANELRTWDLDGRIDLMLESDFPADQFEVGQMYQVDFTITPTAAKGGE